MTPRAGWAASARYTGDVSDDEVWRAVRAVRARLDESNGCDALELTLRLLKVGEEAGEAAQAWIGHLGQNPRKGVTHSRADVAAELADVVLAALVAAESLGLDTRALLAARATHVARRLAAAPESS
jgi:NTP pyrophosphatase (non-canonical NTP hydrolase)